MKAGTRIRWILALLLSLLVLPAAAGQARQADESGASRKCLLCHGKKGIVKTFLNEETVEAYVNPEKIRTSVHNFLTCSECHSGFSAESHPSGQYKSRDQYRLRSSSICRRCHSADKIKDKAVHATLLKKEKLGVTPICTNCHNAHSVTAASGGKVFSNEKQYCQSCHQHELSMKFRNEERMSLKVDLAVLDSSAHGKLRCSDCHYGYSSEEHPEKRFRSRREYIIASSESCRRCHFDNYTKTLDSVHYSLLSHGNLKAPVCNDCHGSHQIAHISHGVKGGLITTQRCKRCHPAVYETYAKSVHGNALINEQNQDVPICIDCHTAHDIQNPMTMAYHEKIPQMCGNCHANPAVVGKYGLSTDVLKTYLEDFHGVTLGFYKKEREELYKPARPIAVCNDCHGTHNIVSTVSADPASVKKNLVKRCQKCHLDATEKFPSAWLFHYKPSLSKYPMIFFVNGFYKIFLPIMWAGLILQVLLHIWRYAVNR
ncbi:MAG TPA: hypothetical protein DEH27_08755 [Deltaproteobacteria bacterium]|nr:hypothetical protein [Deltaproteobacteria bacterium]